MKLATRQTFFIGFFAWIASIGCTAERQDEKSHESSFIEETCTVEQASCTLSQTCSPWGADSTEGWCANHRMRIEARSAELGWVRLHAAAPTAHAIPPEVTSHASSARRTHRAS